MNLDYKSPEQTYSDALNFDSESDKDSDGIDNGHNDGSTAAGKQRAKRSINEQLRGFVQRLNNSAYIYPTVTILIMTLVVIITVFQQSVSMIIKVLLVLVLMAFLFYTIWQFRSKS